MGRLEKALLLLCLLATVPAFRAQDTDDSSADDDEDYEEPVQKGFLIVRKKIFEPDVILGKNMTVIVSIYNAGNRSATVAYPTSAD